MDDRERISRLEATMDAHNQRFDRIDHSLERLDRRLDELRDHTDQGFRDQREHTDRNFAEIRGELMKMTRWTVGIFVTYGIAIVGLVAKVTLGS